MNKIDVPQPFIQTSENSTEDHVTRILKYIYSNQVRLCLSLIVRRRFQDFKSIADEVTEKNVSNLYAQAYALKCLKLLKDLQAHIIDRLLTLENVELFLQISIQFEIPELTDLAITKIVVPNFRDLSESTHKFLQNIPIQHFISIIANDDLYIEEEYELVFLVKKCLEHHEEKGQPDHTLTAE